MENKISEPLGGLLFIFLMLVLPMAVALSISSLTNDDRLAMFAGALFVVGGAGFSAKYILGD